MSRFPKRDAAILAAWNSGQTRPVIAKAMKLSDATVYGVIQRGQRDGIARGKPLPVRRDAQMSRDRIPRCGRGSVTLPPLPGELP